MDLDPRVVEFLKLNIVFFMDLAEELAASTENTIDDLALKLLKDQLIKIVQEM